MVETGEDEFNPKDWIESQKAAEILGRSRSAITRYVQQGKLTGLRIYGRLFVRREEIANFQHPPRGNPKLLE